MSEVDDAQNRFVEEYIGPILGCEPEGFDEAVQELHAAAQKLVDLCVEEFLYVYDGTESKEKLDHFRGQVSIAKGLKGHIGHNTRAMRAEREMWKR